MQIAYYRLEALHLLICLTIPTFRSIYPVPRPANSRSELCYEKESVGYHDRRARAAPALGLICSDTVVVPPLGAIPLSVTHG